MHIYMYVYIACITSYTFVNLGFYVPNLGIILGVIEFRCTFLFLNREKLVKVYYVFSRELSLEVASLGPK
jgi:hypothetical protein